MRGTFLGVRIFHVSTFPFFIVIETESFDLVLYFLQISSNLKIQQTIAKYHVTVVPPRHVSLFLGFSLFISLCMD